MSRGPATFKQADLARAVRAAKSAGLDVVRTMIGPDGTITIFHTDCSPSPNAVKGNPWDDELTP